MNVSNAYEWVGELTEPSPKGKKLRVAVAGLGAIGKAIVRALSQGSIPNVEVTAVSALNRDKAAATLANMGVDVPVVAIDELVGLADVVVECAPAALLQDVVRPFLLAGKKVIILSVGGLLQHPDLVRLAATTGGRIIVPSGALLGLDAVAAAAEGNIHSVRMVSRKPVAGLLGAPKLLEEGIDISQIQEPLLLFTGSAREAAAGFPANLNVAVALSLAGVGPDLTHVEIWADPTVSRNTHRIVVEADAARLDMTIENVPSENPKTGRITPLSVLAVLRKLTGQLRVGS